jgi:hypothetical protein
VSAHAVSAQRAEPRTWEQLQAAFNEHKGELDYLLGGGQG